MPRKKDITSARTFGEAQRHIPRQSSQTGGAMSTLSRMVQGVPDQKRRVDDSAATMRKNRKALPKK